MPSEYNPQTGSTHLRRLILSQSVEGTAVPMVLFSDDTGPGGGDPGGHPEVVTRAAAGLGLDLDGLEMFSFDAYRLQSALGAELAPLDEAPAAAPLGEEPAA